MTDLNARTSKCWTCEFGMCIQEEENQTFFHTDQNVPLEEENLFASYEEKTNELPSTSLVAKQIQAFCYWKPSNHSGPLYPVRISNVTQCNRYKKA